jgi:hypothetical protein
MNFQNFVILILIIPVYITYFLKFSIQSVYISYSFYLILIFVSMLIYTRINKKDSFSQFNKLTSLLMLIYSISVVVSLLKNNLQLNTILIPYIFLLMQFPFMILIASFSEEKKKFFIKNLHISLLPYMLIVYYDYFQLNISSNSRYIPENIQPNQIGEIVFFYIITSIFFQKNLIKVVSIFLGIVILFLLQSRGAMLASFLFLIIYYNNLIRNKIIYFFLILLSLIYFQDFIIYKVLLIDDPYRGLNTGFVGRYEGWAEGISIFLDNFLFGSGYRTNVHVHNGFIRMFSELGFLFSTIVLFVLLKALFKNFTLCFFADNSLKKYYVSSLISYIFLYMFAPRYINLNIMSVFLLFILLNTLIINKK